MKKKAEREKARPPKFGSSIKKKEGGDTSGPGTESKPNEAQPEEVKIIEVAPEEIPSPKAMISQETPNDISMTESPPKPSKPKVHIFSHGIPFFYAHKWVYEDPSSSHNSGLNTGIKKD